MIFSKVFKGYSLSMLAALLGVIVMSGLPLKAEEEELQITTDGATTAKNAPQEENEKIGEEESHVTDSGASSQIVNSSKPSQTILLGGTNPKKKTNPNDPRIKPVARVVEEGMVDVEGEELFVDEVAAEDEISQYSGPGQSMGNDAFSPLLMMIGGESSGEGTVANFDLISSVDTSQQQGVNEVTPQVLADWFLTILKDRQFQQDNTSLGLTSYYKISQEKKVR